MITRDQTTRDSPGSSPGSPTFFRVAAAAALGTVALIVVQILVFVKWPPPSFQPTSTAVMRIFDLLRANPLRGFVELDGLMIVDYVFLILVFLALYVALKDTNPALMLAGTSIALVGIALYFAANPALSMLALSHQISATTPAGDRASTVAAGQAILALFQGTPFLVHYVLMGLAGILVSVAMLQSRVFTRGTAVAGLLQGAMMLIPSTVGTIGPVLALGSLVPFSVWFVLIARRLLRLAGGSTRS